MSNNNCNHLNLSRNYLKIPNEYLNLLKELKGNEIIVLVNLFQLTFAYNRLECEFSISKLARDTNKKRDQFSKALKKLQRLGIVFIETREGKKNFLRLLEPEKVNQVIENMKRPAPKKGHEPAPKIGQVNKEKQSKPALKMGQVPALKMGQVIYIEQLNIEQFNKEQFDKESSIINNALLINKESEKKFFYKNENELKNNFQKEENKFLNNSLNGKNNFLNEEKFYLQKQNLKNFKENKNLNFVSENLNMNTNENNLEPTNENNFSENKKNEKEEEDIVNLLKNDCISEIDEILNSSSSNSKKITENNTENEINNLSDINCLSMNYEMPLEAQNLALDELLGGGSLLSYLPKKSPLKIEKIDVLSEMGHNEEITSLLVTEDFEKCAENVTEKLKITEKNLKNFKENEVLNENNHILCLIQQKNENFNQNSSISEKTNENTVKYKNFISSIFGASLNNISEIESQNQLHEEELEIELDYSKIQKLKELNEIKNKKFTSFSEKLNYTLYKNILESNESLVYPKLGHISTNEALEYIKKFTKISTKEKFIYSYEHLTEKELQKEIDSIINFGFDLVLARHKTLKERILSNHISYDFIAILLIKLNKIREIIKNENYKTSSDNQILKLISELKDIRIRYLIKYNLDSEINYLYETLMKQYQTFKKLKAS